MKILILGGSGMLGHRLWVDLSTSHDVWVTVRGDRSVIPDVPGLDRQRIRPHVDMLDFDNVVRAFASVQPDIAINCVGLVKQHALSNDPLSVIEMNARLPHRLSLVCRSARIRLIHVSTDCVFSGRTGGYTEESVADAEDLYGRSKFLGEVSYPHTLTLRTSIIGRELRTRHGVTEWFLSQSRAVKGYRRAMFSGLTTQAVAKVLLDKVLPNSELRGVIQVSSSPISKYELLQLLKRAFNRSTAIEPDDGVVVDRCLDSSRFRAATGYVPPRWPDMIEEMAASPFPYDAWKIGQP